MKAKCEKKISYIENTSVLFLNRKAIRASGIPTVTVSENTSFALMSVDVVSLFIKVCTSCSFNWRLHRRLRNTRHCVVSDIYK